MEGKVSEQVALDYASSPHDFKLMLAAGGQRASGIEQLAGTPPSKRPHFLDGTQARGFSCRE